MEASSVLRLLEKVLLRHSAQDLSSSSASFSTLHKTLIDSEDDILNLALNRIESLQEKQLIDKKTGKKFTKYINSIKKENSSLTPKPIYPNPEKYLNVKKFTKIRQAFSVILSKRLAVLKEAFWLLQTKKFIRRQSQLKTKKYSDLIKNSKIFMRALKRISQNKLKKAFVKWKFYIFLYPKIILKHIMEKGNLRYFYSKFLAQAYWKDKTWPSGGIISECRVEQQFMSIQELYLQPVKTNDLYIQKTQELLKYLTNHTEYLKKFEPNQRIKAMISLVIKKKRMQENLKKTVKFIAKVNKKRKQLPVRILNRWTVELVKKQEFFFKVSLGFERLTKFVLGFQRTGFVNIQIMLEEIRKKGRVLSFGKLVKNSLNFLRCKRKILSCFKDKLTRVKSAIKQIANISGKIMEKKFSFWKNLSTFKSRLIKAKKLKKMMKILARGLRVGCINPLKTFISNKKKIRALTRLIINICKHFKNTLSISMEIWKRASRISYENEKVGKKFSILLLNNLSRKFFAKWVGCWHKTVLVEKFQEAQESIILLSEINDRNVKLNSRKIVEFTVRSLNQIFRNSFNKWKINCDQRAYLQLKTRLCNMKVLRMCDNFYNKFKQALEKWKSFAKTQKKNKSRALGFQLKIVNAFKPTFLQFYQKFLKQLLNTRVQTKNSLLTLSKIFKKKIAQEFASLKKQIFLSFKKDLKLQIKAHLLSKKFLNTVQRTQKLVLSKISKKSLLRKYIPKNLQKLISKKLSTHLSTWQKSSLISKLTLYINTNKSTKLSSIISKVQLKYYSKSFHTWHKNQIKEKLNQKIQAQNLVKYLGLVSRSTHKKSFVSMVQWKSHIFKALKNLSLSYLGHSRAFFLKWRNVIDNEKRKGAVFALKILKIKGALERIVKSTIRESSSRLLQGAEKMKVTMQGLVNSLKGIPQKAIKRWNKVIVEIRERELFYSYNGQRILMIMEKVPRRTYRETIFKLNSNIGEFIKLRFAFQSIEQIVKKIPKASFEYWKNFCKDVRNKSIIYDYNLQLNKIVLEKVLKRTLRSTIETLKKRPKNLKNIFGPVLERYQKVVTEKFLKWKEFCRSMQQGDLIESLKLKMMQSSFISLCRKRFRDVFARILTGGEKLKHSIQGLITGLNNVPKVALKKWNKVVVEIKEFEMKMGFVGSKLLSLSLKICLRTLREVSERLKGGIFIPANLRGYLINLCNIRKKRPKQAFECWKKFLYEVDKIFLLEQLRSTKLQLMLTKMSTRIIRESLMRLLGGGNKFKGIFFIYISAIVRRPKNAFDRWKDFITKANQKKLMNELRRMKLVNFIKKVSGRVFRSTVSKIYSRIQKINKVINVIFARMKNLQLKGLILWKHYLNQVKQKILVDNYRSEKLKATLKNIIRKTWRRTINLLSFQESTISILKHLYIMLENTYLSGSRNGFYKWKEFTKDYTQRKIINKLKGRSIGKMLNSIILKRQQQFTSLLGSNEKLMLTIKGLSVLINTKQRKQALHELKHYLDASKRKSMLEELATEKLKYSIESAGKRSLGLGFRRIARKNERVVNVLNCLAEYLKKKPKLIVRKWLKNVELLKMKEKLGNAAGITKMHDLLNFIQNKRKMTGFRIIQQESLKKSKLINGVRKMFYSKLRKYLKNWRKQARLIRKNNELLKKKAKKLSKILEKMCKSVTTKSYKILIEAFKSIQKYKVCLSNLKKVIYKLKASSLNNWRKKVYLLKQKSLDFCLKSHILSEFLTHIHKKMLKSSFFLIIKNSENFRNALTAFSNCFRNQIKSVLSDWKKKSRNLSKIKMQMQIKAYQLNQLLLNALKTKMKSIIQQLCVSKDKMKLALNTVVENLITKPKHVLRRWKNEVHYIREQALVNFFRSEKLSQFAEKLVQRTRNLLFHLITGVKNKAFLLNLNLRWASNIIKQMQKLSVDKWKKVVDDEKNKKLRNLAKVDKFLRILQVVRNNKLRKHFYSLLKIVKNFNETMKNLVGAYNAKYKEAFEFWYRKTILCKNKLICSTLVSKQFCECLQKVLQRRISFTFKKVVEDNLIKVKIGLNTMLGGIKKRLSNALTKWNQLNSIYKQHILMKHIQNENFLGIMKKVGNRKLRVVMEKIKNVLPCLKIVEARFKIFEKIVKDMPKHGFYNWKFFIINQEKQSILNTLNSVKLMNLFGNTTRKVKKSSLNRILGGGSLVKGALKTLYTKISKLPQITFSIWKQKNDEYKQAQLKNQIKATKLEHFLLKIKQRLAKSILSQIINYKALLKLAIKHLITSFKAKTSKALTSLKSNVETLKINEQFLKIKGYQGQKILLKLIKNKNCQVFKRLKNLVFTRNLNKVQALILFNQFYELNRLASIYHNWRVRAVKDNLKNKLQKVSGQVIRLSLQSLINSAKGKLIIALLNSERIFKNLAKITKKLSEKTKSKQFIKWSRQTNRKSKRNYINYQKAFRLLSKLSILPQYQGFHFIVQNQVTLRKLFFRISNSLNLKLIHSFSALQENLRKKKIINKAKATLNLITVLSPKPKIMLQGRFNIWKNREDLRIIRLKKKCIIKWILSSSINYQNSFWKLKYVLGSNAQVYDPKFVLIYRKLTKIGVNYQTRLKQYAHFKLLMVYKSTPMVKSCSINKYKRNSEHRALRYLSKIEYLQKLERPVTPSETSKRDSLNNNTIQKVLTLNDIDLI